jgi:hypothetical protein
MSPATRCLMIWRFSSSHVSDIAGAHSLRPSASGMKR